MEIRLLTTSEPRDASWSKAVFVIFYSMDPNCFLTVFRGHDYSFGFPGGMRQCNDPVIDLRHEVWEETGLDLYEFEKLNNLEYLCEHLITEDDGKSISVLLYGLKCDYATLLRVKAKMSEKEAKILPSNADITGYGFETSGVCLVKLDDGGLARFMKNNLAPSVKEELEYITAVPWE